VDADAAEQRVGVAPDDDEAGLLAAAPRARGRPDPGHGVVARVRGRDPREPGDRRILHRGGHRVDVGGHGRAQADAIVGQVGHVQGHATSVPSSTRRTRSLFGGA